jgi:L-2-hydroxyglutarate oxidase LhgO
MSKKQTCDFLIVGGGVVGVTIARSLLRTIPGVKITLLEKEQEVSEHTSGRNSGVLHAGFYYSTESLKAQFCRVGCE